MNYQSPVRYVPDRAALPELHTLYRKDDPDTSRQAAESVEPHLTEIQANVLGIIADSGEYGLTDEQLSERFGTSTSTARTRRAELADRGMVIEAAARRTLRSGRQGRVWKIAPTVTKGYQPCLL